MIPNSNQCKLKKCVSNSNSNKNNPSGSACKCVSSNSASSGSETQNSVDKSPKGETSEIKEKIKEELDCNLELNTRDCTDEPIIDDGSCSNDSACNSEAEMDMEPDNVSAQLDLEESDSDVSDSSSECNGDLQDSLNSSLPGSPLSDSQVSSASMNSCPCRAPLHASYSCSAHLCHLMTFPFRALLISICPPLCFHNSNAIHLHFTILISSDSSLPNYSFEFLLDSDVMKLG